MIAGLFARGFLLGLGAAAPLGPVNVEIIRRSLLVHPLAGAALGAGAVTADTLYIAATYLGAAALLAGSPALHAALGAAGAAFLLWLGAGALRSGCDRAGIAARFEAARLTPAGHEAAAAAPRHGRDHVRARRHYAIGLGMTLLNPMTIVYWMAVSSEVLRVSGGGLAPLMALMAGVAAGAGGWVAFLTASLAAGRRLVGVRFLMAVSILGGALLLAFGAWQAARVAGDLLAG